MSKPVDSPLLAKLSGGVKIAAAPGPFSSTAYFNGVSAVNAACPTGKRKSLKLCEAIASAVWSARSEALFSCWPVFLS